MERTDLIPVMFMLAAVLLVAMLAQSITIQDPFIRLLVVANTAIALAAIALAITIATELLD